jgi:hypothetical protein
MSQTQTLKLSGNVKGKQLRGFKRQALFLTVAYARWTFLNSHPMKTFNWSVYFFH